MAVAASSAVLNIMFPLCSGHPPLNGIEPNIAFECNRDFRRICRNDAGFVAVRTQLIDKDDISATS
jgi:hypothetical protein